MLAVKNMKMVQNFDHFLAKKFASVKRYGGEGAEAAIVAYQQLFALAAQGSNCYQ